MEFTVARSEVDAGGIERVRCESIAQNRFERAFLWKAARQRFPGRASVAGAINAKAAFRSAAEFVRLDRKDEDGVWVVGMHDHGETEIGGHAVGNVGPVGGTIVGTGVGEEDYTVRIHGDFFMPGCCTKDGDQEPDKKPKDVMRE